MIKPKTYLRLSLGTHQDISFKLVVPTAQNKEKYPLYCIEYNYNQEQKRFKTGVKEAYNSYLAWAKQQPKMSKDETREKLIALFQVNIDQIISDLQIKQVGKSSKKITLYTSAIDAVNSYYSMQEEQHARGELTDIYNYRDRNKRLNEFFNTNEDLPKLLLKELSAETWDDFRTYLRNQKLANSTINQYMTYVKSFYLWMIDFKELVIANHPRKLKKLDTSQQESKFKELSNDVIKAFYKALESDGDKWLRLNILTRLVAENTVRPVQVRSIQAKHIDLSKNEIMLFDNKGKKWRTVVITDKTKHLIQNIYDNTLNAGIEIEPNDYLIGGHNQFKKGLPYSQRMFRQLQVVPFRKKHPAFEEVQNYDFKHTTITRTSQTDLVGAQKRAGHSKASTTQIYDKSENKSRAISLDDILDLN